MNTLYPLCMAFMHVKSKTLLFVFVLSTLTFTNSYSQGLVFKNSRLESGKAGADKSTYRFPNVKPGHDALVSIKGRSSTKVELESIDITNSGHADAFQPQVSYNNGTVTGKVKWYMDFEVVIVKAGTKQRVQLDEISCTALDVDGNGDKIREYIVYTDPINVEIEMGTSLLPNDLPMIDFDAENGDAIECGRCNRLSPIVLCSPCNGSGWIGTLVNGILKPQDCGRCGGVGKLHSACGHAYSSQRSGTSSGSGKSFVYTGPTTNYNNIDTFATQVMVTGTWINTDEIIFRVGAENTTTGTNGAADRLYSLYFKTFRYVGATFLPVTLVDWKADLVKKNVNLKWTSTIEKNASHYAIERSFDGKNFRTIATVSAAGNSENRKDYAYTDHIGDNQGVVYYRLVSADVDGKKRVSEIRTVRTATNTLEISVYPNPVVNDLRIAVPANWQGKKVNFEIVNTSGVAVNRMVKDRAMSTETVAVNQLMPGLYIVKATCGSESAVQQLVKSR
jgi:hypothetical protein